MTTTLILQGSTVDELRLKITELEENTDTHTVSVISTGGISAIEENGKTFLFLPITFNKTIIPGSFSPR